MGFLDSILGRSKPVQANLDSLFALPSAAITLQTEAGLMPTGQAGVCFKPVMESTFESMQAEVSKVLGMLRDQHQIDIAEQDDQLGYHWMVITEPDIEGLVANIHLVNSSLQEAGFGPQLLCSMFGFRSAPDQAHAQHAYLVYLFKRGTFYPFVPLGGEKRDNTLEIHLKGLLSKDLKVEEDVTRWFPVWGAPVS